MGLRGMKQHLEQEAELRRYLLGESTLEERVSVEARLFIDDEYRSQMKSVEEELIDDYAYDELPKSEREGVESRLLSKPGLREDLRIVRAFKRYLSQNEGELVTPPIAPPADDRPASDTKKLPPVRKGPASLLVSLFQRRPVVGYALATAAVIIILSTVIWFSLESARRQGRSPQLQAQQPTPQQSRPVEREQQGGEPQANQSTPERDVDVARHGGRTQNGAGGGEKDTHSGRRDGNSRESPTRTHQTPTQVATFIVLPGGVVRGPGSSDKVKLSADIGAVILRLPLVAKGDYQHYRATLREDGKSIYSRAELKPEVDAEVGQVVAFKVPANLLRTRSYRIKLAGVTPTGQSMNLSTYTFEVERP
jgi:hypothetical protein